jgi:hypothetical protein
MNHLKKCPEGIYIHTFLNKLLTITKSLTIILLYKINSSIFKEIYLLLTAMDTSDENKKKA